VTFPVAGRLRPPGPSKVPALAAPITRPARATC